MNPDRGVLDSASRPNGAESSRAESLAEVISQPPYVNCPGDAVSHTGDPWAVAPRTRPRSPRGLVESRGPATGRFRERPTTRVVESLERSRPR
jgi:hypothetical protein